MDRLIKSDQIYSWWDYLKLKNVLVHHAIGSLASIHYALYMSLNDKCAFIVQYPGPLFAKQTDVLPQDLVKSRSREIRV